MGKLFAAWELFVSWRSSSQHKRWWRVWWLCKSELKPCEIWKSCPAHTENIITGPIRMEEREFNEHYMINVTVIGSLSVCKSWNSLKTIKIDKNDAFDNVQLLKMGRLWLKRVSIVLITARTLYAWANLSKRQCEGLKVRRRPDRPDLCSDAVHLPGEEIQSCSEEFQQLRRCPTSKRDAYEQVQSNVRATGSSRFCSLDAFQASLVCF